MNKKIIHTLILLAIGAGFLILWTRLIDMKTLVNLLKKASIPWILIGTACYFTGILIRSIRWKKLLAHLTDISTRTSLHIYLAGQMFNYLIPLRAGELAKSVFLKQKKKVTITKSFPTIIIDKILDLFILLIVIVILLALVHSTAQIPLIWIFMILVILGISFLIYTTKNEKPFLFLLKHALFFFAPKIRITLLKHAQNMIHEIAVIQKKTKTLIHGLLLSLLALLFDAAFFYAMLRAIGMTDTPLIYAFFGYSLIIISYTIPAPPAQLGSNELLYLLVFSALLGLNKDIIAAVTILIHATTTLILILGGIISIKVLNISAKEFFKSKTYKSKS